MNSHNMTVSPVVKERTKLDLRAGDVVKVFQKIEEKGKTRLQVFDGLVLSVKHGKEAGGTFTVRKVASGVGVEKIFPIHSPFIDKIEVVKRAKVRRSKLYHIRYQAAKEIKRQMRNTRVIKVQEEDEEVVSPEAEVGEVAEVTESRVEETPKAV